jgi:hypothetical protein
MPERTSENEGNCRWNPASRCALAQATQVCGRVDESEFSAVRCKRRVSRLKSQNAQGSAVAAGIMCQRLGRNTTWGSCAQRQGQEPLPAQFHHHQHCYNHLDLLLAVIR